MNRKQEDGDLLLPYLGDLMKAYTKLAGTRLRRQGKGRKGHRFKVYVRGVERLSPIFDHNSGETYRCNDDVERWLETYLTECLKGKHSGFWPSSTDCQTCGATFRATADR